MGFVMGFVLGLALGASLALVMAPQPGSETRHFLAEQARERLRRQQGGRLEEEAGLGAARA